MDRREFLTAFGAGIAAFGFDPERLVWVPGAKKIFIPPEKAVEIYSEEEMDFVLNNSNEFAFRAWYGEGCEPYIKASRMKGINPFEVYYNAVGDFKERRV